MKPLTPYLSAEDRYAHDPTFHSIVDIMTMAVANLQLTPTELREAAVYACIRYEHLNMRAISGMIGSDPSVIPAAERIRARDEADRCELRARQLKRWLAGGDG